MGDKRIPRNRAGRTKEGERERSSGRLWAAKRRQTLVISVGLVDRAPASGIKCQGRSA